MKMPRLPKFPTLPKLSKLKLPQMRRPKKKLDARVRAGAAPMMDEYDEDEPQTKLSSAFVVVLLLHVVAVGGIYAFNSIKASRRSLEPASASATPTTPKTNSAAAKPTAPEADTVAPARTPTPPVAPVSKQRVYTVKQGDTLTSVARQFAIGVGDLEAANSLKPAATLRIGQLLNIPVKGSGGTAAEAPKAETRASATAETKTPSQSYTVKSGDRLLFIAKRYNVTPDALAALNKIKDPSKLQVGQTLKIPTKKAN